MTPDGLYAFAVNFNLHGEMVPSSVSVVYTPTNTEVARTTTCTMPHGSRIDPSGERQYSTCMMDDQLVEIDTRTFEVARRFGLAKGREGAIVVMTDEHAGHDCGRAARTMPPATCSPTWAQPSHDGAGSTSPATGRTRSSRSIATVGDPAPIPDRPRAYNLGVTRMAGRSWRR